MNVGIWSRSALWSGPVGLEAAKTLEAHGFEALWLGASSGDLELPERLLAGTERLRVATSIVNIWTEPLETVVSSYRRVSETFGDRFVLGVGAGHQKLVGDRYERPYSKLAEYVDGLDEAGVPRERRALAALGPKALRLAGERSAGALPYLVTPEHTRRAREILGPDRLLAPEQKVVVDPDPDSARATARGALELYLGLTNYTNNLRRLGFTDEDLADGGSDRLVDAIIAWGDVEAIRARVQEHLDAGADQVCLQVITPGGSLSPQQFRRLGDALAG